MNRSTGLVAGLAIAVLAAGCGEAPFSNSGSASSAVHFDLSGVMTSAGVPVCAEADEATLSVSPAGESTRLRRSAVEERPDCSIDFQVTVPKGRVQFVGELLGGGRPLMRGAEPSFLADKDGFVVYLDLDEIQALDIRTETIGLGGPATYSFGVEGSDERFPIEREGADTVAALAGGMRMVTLDAAPCTVVEGPADREVMIPEDERALGATLFRIDCTAGGDVHVVTTTLGGGGAGMYLTAHVGDEPPVRVLPQDSIVVEDVTPGPIDVWLETGCSVRDITTPPYFLPTAGDLRVEFLVTCGGGGGGGGGGPSPTPAAWLRVVTHAVQPPGPGEIETFEATVTDASGFVMTRAIGVADSVTFDVSSPIRNPYRVRLTPTGTCFAKSNIQTASTVAVGGVTRVVFDVGC